jgi:hypothetical protein
MNIFTKACELCGGLVLGPREGKWLGFDTCVSCRLSRNNVEIKRKGVNESGKE